MLQRRSSISSLVEQVTQTYKQGKRKVSDPVKRAASAAVQRVSRGNRKTDNFDFGAPEGSNGSRPRPPDSGARYGLRTRQRKITKEDITFPLLPSADPVESVERERDQRLRRQNSTATQSERPPRPSLDERPPVVRDTQLRMEEHKVYKSLNTSKRPERPCEQDLPFGAAGSIPRVHLQEERPPPPAAAVRGQARMQMTRSNTVPFPSNHRVEAHGATRTTEESAMRAHEPPPAPTPASAKIFTPFAPVSPRDRPQHNTPSRRAIDSPAGQAYLEHTSPSTQRLLEQEYVPPPPPKDPKWMALNAKAQSQAPSPMRRQDGVRKISSSGDVHLPTQHARYQLRDENDPRKPRSPRNPSQDLRTVKSTPLGPRRPNVPIHPSGVVGLPAHPAVYLERAGSRTRPRDPDVPRDVSPDNPQGLPTPRRSFDEERSPVQRHREPQREREAARRASPVATRAQANTRAHSPPAHDHIRSVSHRAQVSPAQRPAPEPEPETDRQKRRREKKATQSRSVEYIGMGDTLVWEIRRALAEPEGVSEPLPIDRDWFFAGEDHGTKPLATRKK